MIAARVRSVTQSALESAHALAFDRGLPTKVGVYFHSLAESDYDAFSEMCAFFRGEGYRLVGPERFLEQPEERCVFVSFDDNHRSWFEAMSLFDSLDVRATFYVNTCAIRDRDGREAIDAYFERLGFDGPRVPLSSAELVALADAGHTIGSHGHSHHRLTAMTYDDALADILTGRHELEAILGRPVVHFAYPYGMRRHFSEELRAGCVAAGFDTISNAIPGLQHAPQVPTSIQRSGWAADRPLSDNVRRISIDGRWFERLTGRSAIG